MAPEMSSLCDRCQSGFALVRFRDQHLCSDCYVAEHDRRLEESRAWTGQGVLIG